MKLGEVIKHRKGFIIIEDDKKYKLCRVQVHRKGVVLRSIVKGSEIKTKKQQVCKAGDFLVAEMDAKFGGYGFIPKELDGAIVSSHYFLFELDEKKIRPKYLEVVSKLLILQDQIKATGSTNYSAIRPAQVLSWEIPCRDIESQKEIETLFETTSEKGSSLKTELTHQQDLLKQLPQSFLNEAMQGVLVKQIFKEGNASELLQSLKTEKAKLIKEKKLKQEKELPGITEEEIPFSIPANWVWCRLGDLGSFRRGPFGSALTKNIFVKEGYKVYEQRNAIYDNHTLGNYFVTKEKFEQLKAFRVFPKDLIISCSGATLGRIAEIPDNAREGIMNQALMRITLFNSTILNSFFVKLFRSPFMQKNIFGQAWGTAIPNMVGLVEIKKILIPLPPIEEQKRIVKKLEEVLNLCEELKTTITNNQNYTDQLLQVALKDALQMKEVEAAV